MTQYLLSVHGNLDEDAADTRTLEDYQPVFEAVEAFNERLRAEGAWVFAGGLQPVDVSTTVDFTGDSPIVTDGPYAESKVEVRPFQEEPEA
jgi:hypothetical protein